jgi:hypothetical protein
VPVFTLESLVAQGQWSAMQAAIPRKQKRQKGAREQEPIRTAARPRKLEP